MHILFGLVAIMIVLMVIAYAFPIIWPLVLTASENITGGANITAQPGMTQMTDPGSQMIVGFWPVILLIGGIGVAVGLLVFVVKKFHLR